MAPMSPFLPAGGTNRSYYRRMRSAPIILVPGFWLGAWAWDEVAGLLEADGYHATALTLPGLDSADTDRSTITAADHVDAICAAIEAADAPVVLAVHSGTGFAGYAASDRLPERIAAMVYVDSGPGKGAMDPDFSGDEMPMPSPKDLAENENLDGLSEDQLATFRSRAIPEPGGVVRGSVELTNPARLDIPTTMICTAYPSDAVKAYAAEQNPSWLAGLAELRDVTWVDLPTSHWVMWSRPTELAQIIGGVAEAHSPS
jgi:pimeloyl-ACP methyl ester carboxylesterase